MICRLRDAVCNYPHCSEEMFIAGPEECEFGKPAPVKSETENPQPE